MIDCNDKSQREWVLDLISKGVAKAHEPLHETLEIGLDGLQTLESLIKWYEKKIEDQEERIAIMSEGGWIPVSQLPKDESDVLLYGEGKGIVIAYYLDGVWYDYQHNHLRNRTNWMPLPVPPKEGEPE